MLRRPALSPSGGRNGVPQTLPSARHRRMGPCLETESFPPGSRCGCVGMVVEWGGPTPRSAPPPSEGQTDAERRPWKGPRGDTCELQPRACGQRPAC